MQVWDRQAQRLVDEPQFGGRAPRLLYGPARWALPLLTHPVVSRGYGRWQHSRRSARGIESFATRYGIDLAEFEGVPYPSFADFFTRRFVPGTRPVPPPPALISPAEAKLTVHRITPDLRLVVKGVAYSLPALVGGATEHLAGGTALVLRLTVDDPHRFTFLDDGRLVSTRRIPGVLHTVGPASDGLPVLTRNTRVVSHLRTRTFGDVVQVEVGALLVGSIVTHDVTTFVRGDEKGYFDLGGSTIVVLLPAGAAIIDADLLAHSATGLETKVRLHEVIGHA